MHQWLILLGIGFTLFLQTSIAGDVFTNGDAGLKFLMTRQFAEGRLRLDLDLQADPWLFRLWKEEGQYPIPENTIARDGLRYPVYPPAFPFLSALPYRILGFRGLLLLPLIATWALWAAYVQWATSLGVGYRATCVSLFVLIFGTPVTFYSATFWEHTLSLALTVFGLALLSREGLRGPLLGAVLVGVSPILREELFVFTGLLTLGFIVASLQASDQRRHLRLLSLSVAAGTVLVLVINLVLFGHVMGLHAETQLGSREWLTAGKSWTVLQALSLSLLSHFPLALPIALGIVLCFRGPRGRAVPTLFGLMASALAVLVPVIVRSDGGRSWGPRYLLIVFPLFCIAGAGLLDQWQGPARRKSGWLIAVVVTLATLAGVRKNTFEASAYLFRNYRARLESLSAAHALPSRLVAISHESVTLQLASLVGPRQFALTQKPQDLRKLANAAREAGLQEFLYVCYPPYGCGPFDDEPRSLTFFRQGTREPAIEFERGPSAGRYVVYRAHVSGFRPASP